MFTLVHRLKVTFMFVYFLLLKNTFIDDIKHKHSFTLAMVCYECSHFLSDSTFCVCVFN